MIRQEQCDKVCRILDDVLANRPTERDSLIVAVRKAFDALEQAETNCSEIPNNSDILSRQVAIEHWRLIIDATSTDSGYNMGFVDGLEFCISHLSTMPSAQPDIILCPNCRYNDGTAYCEVHYRDVGAKDYCSWAERRTGDKTNKSSSC